VVLAEAVCHRSPISLGILLAGFFLDSGAVMTRDFVDFILWGILAIIVAVTLLAQAGEKAACEREHNVYDCVRVYVPAEDVE
jgi:uncharacterized membrane protein YoaK (UPF0700 family)